MRPDGNHTATTACVSHVCWRKCNGCVCVCVRVCVCARRHIRMTVFVWFVFFYVSCMYGCVVCVPHARLMTCNHELSFITVDCEASGMRWFVLRGDLSKANTLQQKPHSIPAEQSSESFLFLTHPVQEPRHWIHPQGLKEANVKAMRHSREKLVFL